VDEGRYQRALLLQSSLPVYGVFFSLLFLSCAWQASEAGSATSSLLDVFCGPERRNFQGSAFVATGRWVAV
jgi:hypothetical protein